VVRDVVELLHDLLDVLLNQLRSSMEGAAIHTSFSERDDSPNKSRGSSTDTAQPSPDLLGAHRAVRVQEGVAQATDAPHQVLAQ
jgi:hypothetical protein